VTAAYLDPLADGSIRLEFEVDVPGYQLPREGTMRFIEYWTPRRRGRELMEHYFDYLREPRPSGRKAHHRHDVAAARGVVHAHCEDPVPRHPHYRDVAVALLEAAEEFIAIHAGGLHCRGLLPLRLL